MVAMFPLGRILATPGALRALERANQSAAEFLARHSARDWVNSMEKTLRRTSTAWHTAFDC
jgi:hypothetical protein